MEEEINEELVDEVIIPEKELSIDDTIINNLSVLNDESESIITIDFAVIKTIYEQVVPMTTIKKLTMVPDLDNSITLALNMFDEESRSTLSSRNFLKIAATLMSNIEIDFYKIFEGAE